MVIALLSILTGYIALFFVIWKLLKERFIYLKQLREYDGSEVKKLKKAFELSVLDHVYLEYISFNQTVVEAYKRKYMRQAEKGVGE